MLTRPPECCWLDGKVLTELAAAFSPSQFRQTHSFITAAVVGREKRKLERGEEQIAVGLCRKLQKKEMETMISCLLLGEGQAHHWYCSLFYTDMLVLTLQAEMKKTTFFSSLLSPIILHFSPVFVTVRNRLNQTHIASPCSKNRYCKQIIYWKSVASPINILKQ